MGEFSDYMSAASNPIASGINFFAGNYMMDKQNQLNIQQWNRENKYNLPVNQVSRLMAAGLSPALMYQNGASGLVSAASPEMRAAQPNFQGVDPLTAAQIRRLDAETESIEDTNSRAEEVQPLTIKTMQNDIRRQTRENAMIMEMVRSRRIANKNDMVAGAKLYDEYRYYHNTLANSIADSWNRSAMTLQDAQTHYENLRAAIKSAIALGDWYEENTKFVGFNAATQRINALSNQRNSFTNMFVGRSVEGKNWADTKRNLLMLEGDLQRQYLENHFLDETMSSRVWHETSGVIKDFLPW